MSTHFHQLKGCYWLSQRNWDVRDGAIHFQGAEEKPINNHQPVELIDNALTYAREIERIV